MADGTWEPAFDEVVSTLEAQVVESGGGAALCVYHHGRPVVDAWTGVTDTSGSPWREDTLAVSYSTTKGVTSTALHLCVDRQLLDYDDRVAEHWPEFAQNGKDTITVRQVLCHEAGLYDVASFLERREQIFDWDAMVAGLERMTPAHEPGTNNGYHAVTFGFIVGEIIRRVSGLGITEFVRTEIAEPLALDGCHIGLPREEFGRLAQTVSAPDAGELTRDPTAMLRVAERLGLTLHPELIAAALPPSILAPSDDQAWLEQPMPSGNGCFTARSLARMYACLAGGGELDGVRLLSDKTIARAIEPQNNRPDLILGFPMQWRLGYHGVLTSAGVLERGFGHNGYGGSGAWGDPDRELAVGYTINALGKNLAGDTRFMDLGGEVVHAAGN
ncbi:MAG TPA: serine hydrolase domain-containing protein [Acidimicrobiia bacterium]|jgi:CubicO group peptidase (beta-lactamase class C family)|nr:serine hydrolase domain-containing protein [Acidimicrobiia bacterium]